jgi:pyridoxine/pyridoxamine 5'-phosphate oxidase
VCSHSDVRAAGQVHRVKANTLHQAQGDSLQAHMGAYTCKQSEERGTQQALDAA